MEKIVQLRESEYDKLFLLANANEKLIQEAAEERTPDDEPEKVSKDKN